MTTTMLQTRAESSSPYAPPSLVLGQEELNDRLTIGDSRLFYICTNLIESYGADIIECVLRDSRDQRVNEESLVSEIYKSLNERNMESFEEILDENYISLNALNIYIPRTGNIWLSREGIFTLNGSNESDNSELREKLESAIKEAWN